MKVRVFCALCHFSPHTHTSGSVEQGVLLIFTQGQQQGAALGWATADAKTSTVNASHYTKNGKILPYLYGKNIYLKNALCEY